MCQYIALEFNTQDPSVIGLVMERFNALRSAIVVCGTSTTGYTVWFDTSLIDPPDLTVMWKMCHDKSFKLNKHVRWVNI